MTEQEQGGRVSNLYGDIVEVDGLQVPVLGLDPLQHVPGLGGVRRLRREYLMPYSQKKKGFYKILAIRCVKFRSRRMNHFSFLYRTNETTHTDNFLQF